jgi:hypothetical protein
MTYFVEYSSDLCVRANKIVAQLPDEAVAKNIAKQAGCKLQCYRGERWYSFLPYGSGKTAAIEALSKKSKIRTEDMAAFGDVSNDVKTVAQQIYGVIAKAESTVHGDSLEELHFHEVGRDQAIANVVGVAACLNELKTDEVIVSDICDGHGTVKCAHGLLNVPVPAVKAMLDDCALSYRQTEYEGEMVTPSGLAMVIGSGAVTGNRPEGTPVRKSEAFGARKVSEHGLIAELYVG